MNNELLKQVKDKVAKKNGFVDWEDCQRVWLDRTKQVLVVHENYIEQVAELYSSRQREEDRKRIEELQEDLRVTENVKLSYLQAYNRECKRVDELTEEVDKKKLRIQELEKWIAFH